MSCYKNRIMRDANYTQKVNLFSKNDSFNYSFEESFKDIMIIIFLKKSNRVEPQ